MPYVAPTSVSTGDVLTAARYNSDVVGNWTTLGGAWSTWTPTLTGITVGTGVGAGTLEARYLQIGKLVMFNFYFKAGSASTFSATGFSFTLPVAARFTADFTQTGFPGVIHDAGTDAYVASGQVGWTATSNTVCDIVVHNAAGTYAVTRSATSTIPMTWTTNDKIAIHGVYEAA